MGKSILKEKSFLFAPIIIMLYQFLSEEKRVFILSKQLLHSGTSVGANIREAQNVQSPKDFVHKPAISQKDCDESLYWFELLHQSDYKSDELFEEHFTKATEILRMLKSSILTMKQRNS